MAFTIDGRPMLANLKYIISKIVLFVRHSYPLSWGIQQSDPKPKICKFS